jgi:hypothetical protein
MKPVSMRLPKDKAKEMENAVPPVSDGKGPKYPWGLQLRLENESLDKLGITTLPEVGKECRVVGVAKVVSVEQRDREGGETRRHVELQITKLAIEHEDDGEAFEAGFKKGPKRGGY